MGVMRTYRCKCRGTSTNPDSYWADADTFRWQRQDFAYLGLVRTPYAAEGIPWAWHADGRSIDPLDSVFDLIDFPFTDGDEAAKPFMWLGAEALA